MDDHSRLTYSEILADEKETAVAFWERAHICFASVGMILELALTDNGCRYKSRL